VNFVCVQLLDTVLSTRYSRIPIYKGDIDKVTGIVFSKDLLAQLYSVHPTLNTITHLSMEDLQNLVCNPDSLIALLLLVTFLPHSRFSNNNNNNNRL
jgi:CBS domain containing-hemolysin-like protein